jgi:hypothetical protein
MKEQVLYGFNIYGKHDMQKKLLLKVQHGMFVSETEPGYVAQAGLHLVILLPYAPQCWDYRYVSPCSIHFHF